MENRIKNALKEEPIQDLVEINKAILKDHLEVILMNRPKSLSIFAKTSKAELRRIEKKSIAIQKKYAPFFQKMGGKS